MRKLWSRYESKWRWPIKCQINQVEGENQQLASEEFSEFSRNEQTTTTTTTLICIRPVVSQVVVVLLWASCY